MNAGTPPEPGTSRMTIETYRVGPDGKHVGRTRQRTVTATPDPERVADSLAWPPCHCPRCRTGHGPRAR
ncbi:MULTISPECIES: hypothetical protein [unclassified Streptomyces]|uniref:hypothetical protein n=1 Tax=unclassified Streptomyces TaxID=2593676 RepID=UPI001488A946|nr:MULTISPECIES: hypothetical protein [unclassified Streptomyces]